MLERVISMSTRRLANGALVATMLVLVVSVADADVLHMPGGQASLQFVAVGDAGNAADSNTLGPIGAVAYPYRLAVYDVTAAQYCQFLNAVAAADPYGLYNPEMDPTWLFAPCGIRRSGSPGSYTYAVAPGQENWPVNYTSWGDAALLQLAAKRPADGDVDGQSGP